MIVGILGGIGPESTAEYYGRLIKQLQIRECIKTNMDYPNIIINSIPAPELFLSNNNEDDAIGVYLAGLNRLSQNDVDFIVMICNTVHIYYDYLSSQCSARILDIRSYLNKKLNEKGVTKYCVLGSSATLAEKLYEFEGFEIFRLTDEEIEILRKLIGSTNISSQDRERNIVILEQIIRKYEKLGCELFILGCTEIALLGSDIQTNKIDTLDVFVEMTIDEVLLESPKSLF